MSSQPKVPSDNTDRIGTHHWVAVQKISPTEAEVLVAQHDEDGVRRHTFAAVLDHLDRLDEVDLLPHDEGGVHYAVNIDTSDHATRPIYFRRNTFEDVMNDGQTITPKVTCLGFQKTVTVGSVEVNIKALLFISPDGKTVVLADRDIF